MSFWRKELPELDEHRIVTKGGMLPHQREWWDADNFLKALVTGYGSGKTYIAAKRAISLALTNAPAPHAQVSPTYKIARRTIVPTLRELLDGKQTLEPGLTYSYNKSEWEFTIKYKGRTGRIWVMSGQDPQSLKGPNIGSAGLDEPFIMERAAFDQMIARVRDPRAQRKEIFLTGTPEQLNWGYDICEGEERDNFDLFLVQASSSANFVIGEDYVERMLSGYTDKAAQAYVFGLFVSLSEGLVYYGFDRERNVKALGDPGDIELFLGQDFNVNPMAGIIGYVRDREHVHILKEYELPNADTQFMCDTIREEWGDRATTVFPDATGRNRSTNAPSGETDFKILEDAGFYIDAPRANPARRDRYNAVNGKLAPRKGEPTLTIEPTCKRLIRYLQDYDYENMHKKEHMSHLLDATGYPIARMFPMIRPATEVEVIGF